MNPTRRLTAAVALLAGLSLVGCGSGSPFAATDINGSGTVLHGTVLNMAPGFSASLRAFSGADHGEITVTVQDTDITTTVGEDGTFVLRGLPDGDITLLFTDGDAFLGSIVLAGVLPNQELIVSVEVTDTGVDLIEDQRNGIGHGDIEIQGDIDSVESIDVAGDSLFVIAGYEVVARPGTTAIRRGNERLTVEDLSEGDQVHVKGVWMPLENGLDASEQQVLAHEIKLQEEAEDGDSDNEAKVTLCHKKKKTLTVDASAVPAHLGHGDTLGACSG